MKTKLTFISLLVIFILSLTACAGGNTLQANDRLQVIATTSIVADVVRSVGGEFVQVTLLLPLGTDPHTFEPRPEDAAALADTQIVFANGAGLEEFLEPLLESTGAIDKLVEVSAGIELLPFEEHHHEGEEEDHEHHDNDEEQEGHEHHHEGGDPHTWMDPNNVIIWVDNIVAALSSQDPDHATAYRANGDAYAASLRDLNGWIISEVSQIPTEERNLVADHAVFGYFAEEYGFLQVGTITGSFSTNSAPSAQELAALEDEIRQSGAHAVFVGETANQDLANQVASDTGIQVVVIYHASLTTTTGPAPTYLDFMRYNVTAIIEALNQ